MSSKTKEKNAEEKASENKGQSRRDFMVMTATGVACVGVVAAGVPIIQSLGPSKEVLAAGSKEVDLSPIKEGDTQTVMWRGKPVFVRHRTQKEIDEAQSVEMSELKDPESDEDRVQKDEWLVAVGTCTHLGCIPTANKGDYNGWFCPCHGSHYDTSGRIRKGPAPENLHIPEYEFIEDKKIKIG